MKIQTEQLRLALADCGRVVRGKSLNEVTQNVKLTALPDLLEIHATNQDAWIHRRIECESGDNGSFIINFRKLHDVIANTSSVALNLSVSGPGKISLSGEDSKCARTLSVLPPTDWPEAPKEGFKGVGISMPELADGIQLASESADESDDRTESVMIIAKPTRLLIAGCEKGHFWGIYSKSLVCEEKKLMIHRKLAALLPDEIRRDGAVFQASDKMVRVQHEWGSVAVKLSERPMIDFEKYYDARNGLKGSYLDRDKMISACRDALAFTPADKTPTLYMERTGEDSVRLSSRTATDEASDEIQAPGAPLKFAMNARYLLQAISGTKADEVYVAQSATDTLNALFVEHGDLRFIIAGLRWDL